MKKFLTASAGLMVAALAMNTPAQAVVLMVSETGTIYNGYQANYIDSAGLFGAAGGSLLGKTITVTVSENVGTVTCPCSGAAYSNPALSQATVTTTINGITVTDVGHNYANYYLVNNEAFMQITLASPSTVNGQIGYVYNPGSITNFDPTAAQTFGTPNNIDTYLAGIGGSNLKLNITPTSVTVGADLPEPASLALLGVALGGLGSIRRRRAA